MKNEEFVKNIADNESHAEGPVAQAIENQTAKLPSDTFLWLALASVGGSLALRLMDRKKDAIFVGEWAPTLLILGLYNKLVKVAGSDKSQKAQIGRPSSASR